MKFKLKSIVACSLLCVIIFSFASCGTSPKSSIDAIKEKGELVMLTNAAFPPFEYKDGENIVGVDVDIAEEIAKELGVKLKVNHMDFDFIVEYIKTGKGDIGVAGMTVNDKRKEQVDFSTEYITSTQFVIVPAGTDTSTFKLDGKIIGCQEGTTGDVFYASEPDVIKAKEVKRYKSAVDASNDLKLGRVECVIIDELPAKKIVEMNKETLTSYNPGYEKEQYAIAIKKDNKELKEVVDKVLARLESENKIEEFLIKHSS